MRTLLSRWSVVALFLLPLLAIACGGGKAAATPTPRVAASDWCPSGSLWAPAAAVPGSGIASGKVVGLTQFKGKTYCKTEYVAEVGGQKMLYTYYFNEGGTDMWMVTNIGGQIQEMQLAGGR